VKDVHAQKVLAKQIPNVIARANGATSTPLPPSSQSIQSLPNNPSTNVPPSAVALPSLATTASPKAPLSQLSKSVRLPSPKASEFSRLPQSKKVDSSVSILEN